LKKHIWPRIRTRLPKAELHIYGAYPSEQILQLHKPKEGFIVNGFVKDANKVVSEAKIVLAPIRFGAGIKGKLTEAMLNGTPSITTSIGAEGMHSNLPWNGFIEDDFEQFAKKAVELYTNKENWKQSQLNGIEIINNLYSKKELSLMFVQKIKYLLSNIKHHRENNFIGSLLQHHFLQSTKYMSKWIEEKNKN
jgi:glycosyltransferase involved in cell wall biosynthesis